MVSYTGYYLVGYTRGNKQPAIEYIEKSRGMHVEKEICYRTLVVSGDDGAIEKLIGLDIFDHVEKESYGQQLLDA